MTAMIIEDVAAVAMIALFIWRVPVRRNGIPGLHGRGRVPASPFPGSTAKPARGEAAPAGPAGILPRSVPEDERITTAGDRDNAGQREVHVLAEHDRGRGPGHPRHGPDQIRGHENSA